MSTVRYEKHGNPTNVLKVGSDDPVGKLGASQVAIKMLAAPINPADLNMVKGNYGFQPTLPAVGGNEGVGVVTSVGASVKGLQVNDRVIPAKAGFGTWRSSAVADESALHKVPESLTVEQAATLSVNPCAAYRMLKDFVDLQPGDWIIQNGGNSAVGQAVIQLAKHMGYKTISVVRNRPGYESVVEHLQNLGGDIVVPEHFMHTEVYDKLVSDISAPRLALNCVGGRSALNLSRALGENGVLVTYGGMSRESVQLTTSAAIFKNITSRGFWLSRWVEQHSAEERGAMLNELAELAAQGKLHSFVERNPFAQFEAALERSQEAHSHRKVLLMME